MTTICINKLTGNDLLGLIYPNYLSILPQDSQEVMQRSIMNSTQLWVVTADGKIGACWGVIPPTLMSDTAYLWFYNTENFKEHTFLFVRHSQRAIAEVLKSYPRIVGHCMVGRNESIRWLRWLGAVFGTPEDQLIPFTIEAH